MTPLNQIITTTTTTSNQRQIEYDFNANQEAEDCRQDDEMQPIRQVKLRQDQQAAGAKSKLGFSLRGGKSCSAHSLEFAKMLLLFLRNKWHCKNAFHSCQSASEISSSKREFEFKVTRLRRNLSLALKLEIDARRLAAINCVSLSTGYEFHCV